MRVRGAGHAGRGRTHVLTPCLISLALLAACAEPDAPRTTPRADTLSVPAGLEDALDGLEAEVLDVEGDTYAMVALEGVVVQWADLEGTVLNHVLGPVVEGGAEDSHFHPRASSPAFGLMPPGTVTRQQSADPRLLMVMNGAFFEAPGQPSTQLAFPISENGLVVSGGSSPAGPGQPGAESRRWGQPLRALALDGAQVRVAEYDVVTGAPLGLGPFEEAVVSYAPSSHPTRTPNRFHVLGPVAADSSGASQTLIIGTSDGSAPIDSLSAFLARLGVAPEHQIALDGGASVYVWNRRAGTLARPTAAGGHDPQHLPHVLTLRLR